MKKLHIQFFIAVFCIFTLKINAQWTGTNPVLTNSDAGIFINTASGLPEGKLHIHQFINNGITPPSAPPYKMHLVLGTACVQNSNPDQPVMNPTPTTDYSIEPSCGGDLEIFRLESYTNMMNARGPIVGYTGAKTPVVSFGAGRTLFHGAFYVGGDFSVNPLQNSTTVNTDMVVNGSATFNNGLSTNTISSINSNGIDVGSDLNLLSHKNIILKHGTIVLRDASNTNQLKLYSDGNIRAREIKVDVAAIPDYVFKEGYKLMPLEEVETYIQKHKHLPNIKGEKEFSMEEGLGLGEMNLKLLEKVEELTLHLIEQDKKIKTLESSLKKSLRK